MEYWTILWIVTLGGPYDGDASFMVYRSYDECISAQAVVGETLGYDYQTECEVTDVQSSSIRPKRNPIYEGQP